jgi:hypothetical protein
VIVAPNQGNGLDPETPISILSRFAITTIERDLAEFTVVGAMPIGGTCNPFTGLPTVAGLAVLVDDVAGRVNYDRCGRGQWTVSSELVVEMSPGAIDSILAAPDEPVVASARRLQPPQRLSVRLHQCHVFRLQHLGSQGLQRFLSEACQH